MSYLEQYLDCFNLLSIIEEDFKPNIKENRKHYEIQCSTKNKMDYELLKQRIKKIANDFYRTIPPEYTVHACHAVSHNFYDCFYNNINTSHQINITIGDVLYKGKSIYNVTKDVILNLIKEGPTKEGALPVHVWLTLEDMTVVDLTIVMSLVDKGILELDSVTDPIVFWNDSIRSDYEYKPILVDNNFLHKVDYIR